ncbi:hypothetical protein KBC03_00430 [Patescibacteria group bacterium]|nr:hypothetical protein [Patescibacteria group bacterium]
MEKIAKYSDEYGIDTIIEIGPGKCALTRKLIQLGKKVILFEKDLDLCDLIESVVEESGTDIIRGDVLEQEPIALLKKSGLEPGKTIVAGNLPYYITSPILTKFFGGESPAFDVGIFMVQKEVADKIKHDAEKKSFLWRLLNYNFDVLYLKTVPAKAFSPRPKVQSSIISLIRKKQTPGCSYPQMRTLLERISMYKRKTLSKSRKMAQKDRLLKPESVSKDQLMLGDYSYTLPEELKKKRIEEVSWEEMDLICRAKL